MSKRIYISDICRRMFRSAFMTAMFTEFISIIALTIDSIIVSAFFGEDEIASVGIAAPFFFIAGIPATCFSTGLQTLASHEIGRGNTEKVNKIFSEVLIFTVFFVVAMSALIFFNTPLLAYLFGARGNVAELSGMTQEYLHGLSFDAAPFILTSVISPIVVLNNGNNTVVTASVAGAVTNIVLDIASVINHWGLFGIGMASALAAFVSLFITSSHFFRKNLIIKFHLARVRFETIAAVVKLGFANVVHSASGIFRSIALNTLVAAVGDNMGMSALTIYGTIVDFVDIIPVGIAGGVNVLTGLAYGEDNGEEIEEIGALAHKYIFIFSSTAIVLLLLLRDIVSDVFLVKGSDTYFFVIFVINCIAAGVFFSALTYSRISYLQAISKEKSAEKTEAAANLFLPLYLAFMLAGYFGIYGVFIAFPLSKALVIAAIYVIHAFKSRKFIPSRRDYLELDDKFFPAEKNVISYSFGSLDECILTSEQLHLFAIGHGISQRNAYLSALCAEEITTNIIFYSKDPKTGKSMSEFRTTISDGNLIMRIRDSGKAFNLGMIAKMLSECNDPYDNIGLKLISASATDVNYYRIYGMNTVIIKI